MLVSSQTLWLRTRLSLYLAGMAGLHRLSRLNHCRRFPLLTRHILKPIHLLKPLLPTASTRLGFEGIREILFSVDDLAVGNSMMLTVYALVVPDAIMYSVIQKIRVSENQPTLNPDGLQG
jgi:hypothetical protein